MRGTMQLPRKRRCFRSRTNIIIQGLLKPRDKLRVFHGVELSHVWATEVRLDVLAKWSIL